MTSAVAVDGGGGGGGDSDGDDDKRRPLIHSLIVFYTSIPYPS